MSQNEASEDMLTSDDTDVERRDWTPTAEQFARYKAREAALAKHNRGVLERLYDGPRHTVVITNGLPEYRGYHAIGVLRGGAHPEDTLHSLASFGAGGRKAHVMYLRWNDLPKVRELRKLA